MFFKLMDVQLGRRIGRVMHLLFDWIGRNKVFECADKIH
jgi:hypothetical protein